jgi:hypothetical protein
MPHSNGTVARAKSVAVLNRIEDRDDELVVGKLEHADPLLIDPCC